MSRVWTRVSPAEARLNPLYGVKNWLAVFAIGIVISALRPMAVVSSIAREFGVTPGQLLSAKDPAGRALVLCICVNTIAAALILLLLASKEREFRNAATVILLITFPVTLGFVSAMPEGSQYMSVAETDFLPWLMSCAIWITYLQRSRRVRVTFEHLVLIENRDRVMAGMSVPAQVAPPTAVRRSSETTSRDRGVLADLPVLRQTVSSQISEEAWTAALQEFEGPARRPGLWAKFFAECHGNDSIAQAKYLQHRAQEIHGLSNVERVNPTTLDEELAMFGIERVGDEYHYQTHKYDKLEDALRYARLDRGRITFATRGA